MSIFFVISVWFWRNIFIEPSRIDVLILSIFSTFVMYDFWCVMKRFSK
jgi:hypothetical protein